MLHNLKHNKEIANSLYHTQAIEFGLTVYRQIDTCDPQPPASLAY